MLFNSLQFAVFFPIVAIAYFALPHRHRWWFLLSASCFFYMYWRPAYILIVLFSATIDYVAAFFISMAESKARRRSWLLFSLITNLGLLFWFKYFNFFNATLADIFDVAHIPYGVAAFEIILPIGISFYTFQALSYTIDVYRGQQPAERHYGRYLLYVLFFPQLVAGPIERSTHLMPQFREVHFFNYERAREGLLIMACGFFKKLVIADRIGPYVDTVFSNPTDYSGLPVLVAFYFFTFQIYADFSGYSDIAVGAAKILGFDLMRNFDTPFYSKSIGEFWRRWHVSLSTWFRDYVYIPLGGNRVSDGRLRVNLFIVFMLSGLWHGANWTFVFWGALHSLYLIAGLATLDIRNRVASRLFPGRLQFIRQAAQIVITFHLVVFGFVFFRADSIGDALVLLTQALHGLLAGEMAIFAPMSWPRTMAGIGAIVAMECVHAAGTVLPVRDRVFSLPLPLRWSVYYAIVFAVIAFGAFSDRQFIYFQF